MASKSFTITKYILTKRTPNDKIKQLETFHRPQRACGCINKARQLILQLI